MDQTKTRRGIQSVEIGGQLLLALADYGKPMPLRELAKAAGMPAGKAHPYLVSFAKLGLVSQEPVSGHYFLGPTAIVLGVASLQMQDPIREATPLAEALSRASGHSVALAVWGSHGATVVRLLEPAYPLHPNMRAGTVMSLAGTATGKVFAAWLPTRLVEAELEAERRRIGPEAMKALKLDRELAETRRHGLSRTIDHPTPGISAFGAPVFDYSGNLVLSITLMGSTGTFDPAWDGVQAKALQACANEVSSRLGYRP